MVGWLTHITDSFMAMKPVAADRSDGGWLVDAIDSLAPNPKHRLYDGSIEFLSARKSKELNEFS